MLKYIIFLSVVCAAVASTEPDQDFGADQIAAFLDETPLDADIVEPNDVESNELETDLGDGQGTAVTRFYVGQARANARAHPCPGHSSITQGQCQDAVR